MKRSLWEVGEMPEGKKYRNITLVAFFFIILLALYVRLPGFYMETEGRDTYFAWMDGKRIATGVNPYERITHGDMIHNEKYPTRLPLVYLIAALFIKLGAAKFESFIYFWRIFILIFDLTLGTFLFNYGRERGKDFVGLLAAFVWFFSRWGLYVWEIGNSEAFIILMMVLALYYWDRKPFLAGLLLGVSLSMKHFGVLFLPVLICGSRDLREGLRRLGYVLLIPAALSLPFFVWHPEGFVKSIFFNVVREYSSHLIEDSISIRQLFGKSGIILRLFEVVVYLLFWVAAVRERWNRWLGAALTFFIFLGFNPVLFTQYFSWMVPFILLYLIDVSREEKIANYE